MENKIVHVTIAATLLVLLVGALVAPIITDSIEDGKEVYYNASSALPLDYESGTLQDHSLQLADGVITIDNEDIALPATLSNIFFADSFRIYGDSSALYYADNQSFSTITILTATDSATITLNGGSATVAIGSYSATVPYEWIYMYSEEGSYVTTNLGAVKILDVKQITAEISDPIYYGVIHNGEYSEALSSGAEPSNNLVWTQTETDGYVTVTQIQYGSQGVLDSSFPVIVPAKIIVDTEESNTLKLLAVIPILILVMGMAMIVSVFPKH